MDTSGPFQSSKKKNFPDCGRNLEKPGEMAAWRRRMTTRLAIGSDLLAAGGQHLLRLAGDIEQTAGKHPAGNDQRRQKHGRELSRAAARGCGRRCCRLE